jgi:hypothetical protein
MKKFRINQNGFSHVEIGSVVVIVFVMALVGYVVKQRSNTLSTTASNSSSSTSQPPAKTTKAQLRQSATSLDNTNVDSIDLSQIDSDLNSLL